MTTATKIAELNDVFRTTFIGGNVVMTEGIQSIEDNIREEIIRTVREFNTFTSDNGPHQEHDLAVCNRKVIRFFWKIDYYDAMLPMTAMLLAI